MASNAFSQLFSGLSPDLNNPAKFQFLQNFGKPAANMSIAPAAPNQSVPNQSVPSNVGATVPVSTTIKSPAGQQFVSSQLGQANQTVAAGSGTPGYTYVNGKLTTVGGQPVPPITSTPTAPAAPSPTPITGNTPTPSGATVNADTGAVVTPPPSAATSNYTNAYNAYIQSLQPSADVTSATSKLNADTLANEKATSDALVRPGDTIGGAGVEANNINRNNSFTIDADTNALNAYTGQQTARTNASQAQLDYEKSLLPSAASTDPYTLSAGQTRYDSTGKAIASAPAAATAPKIIGDSSTGYYTVGDDGKLTKLLGAAPKTAAALTETQAKSQAYSDINKLLGMADENGIPYLDSNGLFTPEGFKSIVQNAAEDGLSRSDIIAEYAGQINPLAATKYGLTAKEKTDLGID